MSDRVPTPLETSATTVSRADGARPALWGEAGAEARGSRVQDRPGPASTGPADPPTTRVGDRDRPAPAQDVEPGAADNSTLRRLRSELGNDVAVDHFVQDFLALLDQRLGALRGLIARRRLEDCVTALLTIETSGLMVGADELAATATRLRLVVSEQRAEPVAPLLDRLAEAAEQTKRDLSPPTTDA